MIPCKEERATEILHQRGWLNWPDGVRRQQRRPQSYVEEEGDLIMAH